MLAFKEFFSALSFFRRGWCRSSRQWI